MPIEKRQDCGCVLFRCKFQKVHVGSTMKYHEFLWFNCSGEQAMRFSKRCMPVEITSCDKNGAIHGFDMVNRAQIIRGYAQTGSKLAKQCGC